jgi:hypothetical protein
VGQVGRVGQVGKRSAPLVIFAVLCSVAVVCLAGKPQAASSCTFPGARESCPDPQNRWAIQWREPASIHDRHQLWLKPTDGGLPIKLLEFDRSVDLLWSPDGRALAVTDHSGSSDSELTVRTGAHLEQIASVEEKLHASLGQVPALMKNGHRYFEATRWLRENTSIFLVRAYDAEPGKEYRASFQYNLSGRVTARK